jgi:hypothetical protein
MLKFFLYTVVLATIAGSFTAGMILSPFQWHKLLCLVVVVIAIITEYFVTERAATN